MNSTDAMLIVLLGLPVLAFWMVVKGLEDDEDISTDTE